MGVGGQHHARAGLPPGKTRYQLHGWAPGPVYMGAENLAPSPEFDPRTVQPVASRYTYWAIQAHCVEQLF